MHPLASTQLSFFFSLGIGKKSIFLFLVFLLSTMLSCHVREESIDFKSLIFTEMFSMLASVLVCLRN
jgi:hypothetical protein